VNPGLSYSSIGIYFGELPDWLFCHPTTNRLKNNPKIIPGPKPGVMPIECSPGQEAWLYLPVTCLFDPEIADGMLLVVDHGILVILS
jgi:hypothetical protein